MSYNSNFDGGMYQHRVEPSATISGQGMSAIRSTEGKVARMFIEKTNLMYFDADTFAEIALVLGGQPMQPRLMAIVKALIRNLAQDYDLGVVNDATIEAKRLMDTMEHYKMQ